MPQKSAGQKLLEELQNEAQEISQAMADAEIANKAKRAASAVASAVEDVAEDVVEEIVDDSNLLLRKVKEVLPSRESAFKVIKVIAYWELVKLMLGYIL
jgi:molecular chaperone GrpE (heat shock protein)